MTFLRVIIIMFAGLAIPCFIGLGHGGIAANPQWEQKELEDTLADYLVHAAFKFDCYFTIENMTKEEGGAWIWAYDVKGMGDPSSIDELIERLSANVQGVRVYRSKKNPVIVHIIDDRLDKLKAYPMPECVAIECRGSLDGLLGKIVRKLPNINLHTGSVFGVGGGIVDMSDSKTKVHVSTSGSSVRRVLTDWLPLSHYNRILWTSVATRVDGGDLDYMVDYPGQIGDGKVYVRPRRLKTGGEVDAQSGIPLVNGIIPFDYGETAYYQIPDLDEEKARVILVNQAVTFIDERLHADKPLQVRWAMFYLGKRKAKEGVPVLLKHLDYRYTTCGILEESYPAVRALTQIGQPAADAAFDELVGKDQSDLRVRLLAAVVGAVEGPKPAQDRLEKALTSAKDDAQKKRLQLAVKSLEDEKE
jgi:hypothetical protein